MTKARDLANAADVLDDVSATELGYVNGVTSAIQTQIDGKSSTSHNHDSTYISKSLVDAAGDLIYGSANDTVTRLGIGTAGQYLKVNSGATAPEWATLSAGAGNMVQVATGTLSGSSVTLSSLSSYTDLVLILFNVSMAANGGVFVRLNNNSGSNYAEYYGGSRLDGALVKDGSQTETKFAYNYAGGNQISGANAFYLSKFTNCKNAGFTDYELSAVYRNSGSFDYYVNHKGVYKVSEAVSSLVIIANGTTFSDGTYILFGA